MKILLLIIVNCIAVTVLCQSDKKTLFINEFMVNNVDVLPGELWRFDDWVEIYNAAKYGWCLSNLVAFLRLNLFVKFDLRKLLDEPFVPPPQPVLQPVSQGVLFQWGIDFEKTIKSVPYACKQVTVF